MKQFFLDAMSFQDLSDHNIPQNFFALSSVNCFYFWRKMRLSYGLLQERMQFHRKSQSPVSAHTEMQKVLIISFPPSCWLDATHDKFNAQRSRLCTWTRSKNSTSLLTVGCTHQYYNQRLLFSAVMAVPTWAAISYGQFLVVICPKTERQLRDDSVATQVRLTWFSLCQEMSIVFISVCWTLYSLLFIHGALEWISVFFYVIHSTHSVKLESWLINRS